MHEWMTGLERANERVSERGTVSVPLNVTSLSEYIFLLSSHSILFFIGNFIGVFPSIDISFIAFY